MLESAQGEEDYNALYKIILIGDSGVGKTHLMNKYVKQEIPTFVNPTIGVDFATKIIQFPGNVKIKAQVYDTAGQERYRAITSSKAQGALVVYDITKEKTYDNVARWLQDLKTNSEPDIVIMMIGNKIDLVNKNPAERKVFKEDAQAFAQNNNCLFFETSAIEGINVNDCFQKLLTSIYESKGGKIEQGQNTIHLSQGEIKKSGGCCSG